MIDIYDGLRAERGGLSSKQTIQVALNSSSTGGFSGLMGIWGDIASESGMFGSKGLFVTLIMSVSITSLRMNLIN